MIILLHVLIALASLGFTTYVYFAPSAGRLRLAYSLVGLTVASGVYLVLSKPANMVQACLTGLVYLAVVTVGILAARNKLAKISV